LDLPNADWDDDDPENPPPVKPGGLDKNLFYRWGERIWPDELGRQRAMRFSQAMRDQQVYRETIESVAQQAQAFGVVSTDISPVA